MKKYIFMAFVSSLFFACQKSETQQQLEQADSLMTHNQPQKAYTILNHIEPESIDNEDEEAYFWLLKYEAEQQLHHDIKDTYKLEDACDHFFYAFSEK